MNGDNDLIIQLQTSADIYQEKQIKLIINLSNVIEIRQSLTLAVESLTQPSPFIRAWDRLRIAKLLERASGVLCDVKGM